MPQSYYPILALFKMQLPSLPRSTKGIRQRAQSQQWPSREVNGRGGPRGKRTEYQVPPEIQREIDAHLAKASAQGTSGKFVVQDSSAAEAKSPAKVVRDLADQIGVGDADSLMILVELMARGDINETGARCVLQHVKALLKGD